MLIEEQGIIERMRAIGCVLVHRGRVLVYRGCVSRGEGSSSPVVPNSSAPPARSASAFFRVI